MKQKLKKVLNVIDFVFSVFGYICLIVFILIAMASKRTCDEGKDLTIIAIPFTNAAYTHYCESSYYYIIPDLSNEEKDISWTKERLQY